MTFLSQDDLMALPPGKVGQTVYRILGEVLGELDPYAELKLLTNAKALSFEPHMEVVLAQATDPLRTALKLAIMGNIIDFAAETEVNLDEELANLENHGIAIDDSDALFADIKNPDANKILYIGDNAGEIVFDKVFLQELLKQYPTKQFVFAVRSGPIINDATMEDAAAVGLADIVRVIECSQSPGVQIAESCPEFQEEFQQADVIIAKGQGNFEALSEPDLPTSAHVYFLLKAKCRLMEQIFECLIGSLIVKKFQ